MALFSEKDLDVPYNTDVRKKHILSGRTVTYSFGPNYGHSVTVSGGDLGDRSISVTCDGDDVNYIADTLCKAPAPKRSRGR